MVSDGEVVCVGLGDGLFDGLAAGLARMPGRFFELPLALSEGASEGPPLGATGEVAVAHGPGD